MKLKKLIADKIKKLIKKFIRIIEPKVLIPKDEFSKENYGIISRLEIIHPIEPITNKNDFKKRIIGLFGIQTNFPFNLEKSIEGIKTIKANIKHSSISYDESYFKSYDGLEIPIYVIYPPNFNTKKKYPCILIFSGHGSSKQVAFDEGSYQQAAGTAIAQEGFLVYVMENRGMGKLSHLGNHLRIDAVARVSGGSWYGEIMTDALWLIEKIHLESIVDIKRIGTAGVSTGGAISMIISAIDTRIAVSYVQGFLGSFRKTFGIRGGHCLCGHIPSILKLGDMSDIASLIAPRPVLFVNGTTDNFYYLDASEEFNKILATYKKLGVEDRSRFLTPKGVGHEFTAKIAINWFTQWFIDNNSSK